MKIVSNFSLLLVQMTSQACFLAFAFAAASLSVAFASASPADALVEAAEDVVKVSFGVPESKPFNLLDSAFFSRIALEATSNVEATGQRVQALQALLSAYRKLDEPDPDRVFATFQILLAVVSQRMPPTGDQKLELNRVQFRLKLHSEFSSFAFSIGRYREGVLHSLHASALQKRVTNAAMEHMPIEADVDVEDADENDDLAPLRGEVPHGLVLLTGGCDTYAVHLARYFLRNHVYMRKLYARCGANQTSFPTPGLTQYTRHELLSVFSKCIVHQDIVNVLDGLRELEPFELFISSTHAEARKNARNQFGYTSLQLAVTGADLSIVKALINLGVEIDMPSTEGPNALHLAVMMHDLAAVRALVNAGSDLALDDGWGRTAIDIAEAHRALTQWTRSEVLKFCTLVNSLLAEVDCQQRLLPAGAELGAAAGEQSNAGVTCTVEAQGAASSCELANSGATNSNSPAWPFPPPRVQFDEDKSHTPLDFGDGGWRQATSAQSLAVDWDRCDVDVRWNLEPWDFLTDYVALRKPVLIRNALTDHLPLWRKHIANFTRAGMLQRWRGANVTWSAIPYSYLLELPSRTTNLTTFIDYLNSLAAADAEQKEQQQQQQSELREYVMQALPMRNEKLPLITHPLLNATGFLAAIAMPQVIDPHVTHIQTSHVQLFLGPENSGSQFHFHRHAWNLVLFGAKRWFLQPPQRASYSRVHTATWVKDVLPTLKGADRPFECTQRQGDLMYVPEAWGHAVLNLAETVGYAGEFSHGYVLEREIESPSFDREARRKDRLDKLRKKNRKLK